MDTLSPYGMETPSSSPDGKPKPLFLNPLRSDYGQMLVARRMATRRRREANAEPPESSCQGFAVKKSTKRRGAEAPKTPPSTQWQTNTASLELLQNDDQRSILSLVDLLRQNSLDSVLSLPQLVVCGDQSSGKSSVLEAITEIPFPRKDNLCTRFATEIILCRSTTSSITTRLIPDKRRPANERSRLENFELSITKFDELPALIDKATELMGLGQETGGGVKAFSKDVLSIQITGPDRPQLTLVDLPGLIHSENKSQSREDVELVSELVQEYILNPRTIILAVISAKNDYANQVILKRCREVDPQGCRTLGIITKPDTLYAGSESEAAFISLARNEDHVNYFSLGWHILKNVSFEERHYTFAQRNQSEASFLSRGEWAKLPRDSVGVEAIRTRLSDLLFAHIKKELPALKQELESKHAEAYASLQRLGENRKTVYDQKQYLMKLSMRFYDLTKAGTNGVYEADFFGKVDAQAPSELGTTSSDVRRLCAVVKHRSLKFSRQMLHHGAKYVFEEDTPEIKDEECDSGAHPAGDMLSKDEAAAWVKNVLIRTRGRELPGNFNPLIISELFWEQSEKWKDIALEYTEEVSRLCQDFVDLVLDEVAPNDVSTRVHIHKVDDELQQRLEAARAELGLIIGDMRRHPVTYNHYYTTSIRQMRTDAVEEAIGKSLDESVRKITDENGAETLQIDKLKILKDFYAEMNIDMDQHSCSDILMSVKAFYKVAMKTFVDNVTIQVVDRHVIHGLEGIFSPIAVGCMDDEDIQAIASEPSTLARQRDHLEKQLKMLDDGRRIFRAVVRRVGLE